MKLPASSNSSTGGAAMPFWSLRTVVGRWRIQAWPWLSIETLETWPHTHLLGNFGHDGSTSKCGIMRGGAGVCAEAAVTWPDSAMAATKAKKVKRGCACIGDSRSYNMDSCIMDRVLCRRRWRWRAVQRDLWPQGYLSG